MGVRTAVWTLMAAAGALVAPVRHAVGQARDSTPCCLVVRVDTTRGIVTARETATGYTFRVEVRQKKLVTALKVGDKVWANFTLKRVRLAAAGDSLCCAILEPPPRPPKTTREQASFTQ